MPGTGEQGMCSRPPLVVVLALSAACAGLALTPQQEWVMAKFNECQIKTNALNAKLTRVEPNGRYYVEGQQTQSDFNKIQACMQAESAAIRARVADAEQRPGTMASGRASTSVEFEPAGNAMIVTASVNGAADARLMVDTGASLTTLSPAVAQRAGIKVDPAARTEIITVVGGRTVTIPIVRLQSLKVGDALVSDMEIGVFDSLPASKSADGLLGNDFLRRFRFSIDRAQKRLTLETLSR
jgi:clan AA aspartic protease (TIGR02281 family)